MRWFLTILFSLWLAGTAESCLPYHAVQDHDGNTVPGLAVLSVNLAGTTTKATIYSDPACTTVATNPVSRGATDWSFWATDGVYDLVFSLGNIQFSHFYGVSLFDNFGGGSHFNVKAYGARGDGVTNDAPAIQRAIDAAAGGVGGTIFFPTGNYLVAAALTGLGNDLLFQGAGNAWINKAFNGDLFTTGGAARIKFQNLNVNAAGNTYTGNVLVFSQFSQHIEWTGGTVLEGADSIFYYKIDGGYESIIRDAAFGLSSSNLAAGAVVKNEGTDTAAMPRHWHHLFTLASTWFYKGDGMRGFYADHVYSAGFSFTGNTSLGITLNNCRHAIPAGQTATMDGNSFIVSGNLIGGNLTLAATFINSSFQGGNLMDPAMTFTNTAPASTFVQNPITQAIRYRQDIAFAALGTPGDGTELYCNDCTVANPCAGGGTGAMAKRLNGAWRCN